MASNTRYDNGAIFQPNQLRWGILAFVFLFCQNALFPQNLPFEHWSTDNGLSNNWVSDVLHDSRGFVWIATQYGVNQFDGHEFKFFRCNPNDPNSLNSNWVRSMTEDADGNVWFGTYGGGLARFNPYLEKFTRFAHDRDREASLPDNQVYKVLATKDKRLWVATFKGVAWSTGNGIFHQVTSSQTYDIREDARGTLWLATQDGLYSWQNDRLNPVPALAGQAVFSVFPCPHQPGKVWVCAEKGLLLLEKRGADWQLSASLLPPHINPNRFFSQTVFLDSRHRVWAGWGKGIITVEAKDCRGNLLNGSLPVLPHNLHSVSEDKRGNIWLGTNKGLFMLKAATGKFSPPSWGMALHKIKLVREVLQWKDETWVATPEGLFSWKGNSSQKILDASINGLLLAADGLVYAAPANANPAGIFRIQPKTKSHEFLPFPPDAKNRRVPRKVWSLAQDKLGGIWIGAQGCLYRFDPPTGIFRPFFDHENRATDIFIDLKIAPNGHLWVGTLENGLYKINNPGLAPAERLHFKRFRFEENNPNSLTSDIAEVVLVSKTGLVWVGTDAGLNSLDPASGKVQRYLREDGLRDEKIMGLVEDDVGRLWISTAGHGITCLDTSHVFWHFDKKDGLVSNDFLLGSCFQREDGALFFGAEDGLQIILPDSAASRRAVDVPIYFTSFINAESTGTQGKSTITLDSSIHFTKHINIPPGPRTLTFEFAALNFEQADHLQYDYRLLPLNTAWQPVGNVRKITLTQVPPGNHTLEIRAKGGELFPGGVSNSLQLHVQPMWYQSFPAKALGVSLVLFGFIWVYKFRVKRKLAAAETRRLQELDQVKTRLYTNITHEFRTPLTLINGMSERLKNKVDFEAREGLKMISRNGQQLLDLVNQLLDLAKLESGSMPLNMVQDDVILFLKYLFESFHSIADANNISLHFSSKMKSFTMDYDPDKLRQIVSNLLANAVKFTPPGGRVELAVGNNAEASSDSQLITITDTGPGIPPEKLPFIFDRFYQADDSATRHAEGSGIGLTLTKELVKLLGGEISVESTIGKGTSFTVSLPVSRNAEVGTLDIAFYQNTPKPPAADAHQVSPDTPNEAGPSRPTVLIIEDNVDVVKYIREILKKDYNLLIAPNGKIGLELAQQEIPDLVLSDVMMPVMDGFETCHHLKNDLATSHIPLVLLTAKSDADSRIQGLEEGADAYLPKPFYEKELQATLKNLLDNREKMRQHYTSNAFLNDIGKVSDLHSEAQELSRDEQFLKTFLAVVEATLDDPYLTVEQLAQRMHVSYSSLFRKVKALTGMGVTEYIRHVRLLRAADLLITQQGLSISEVAQQVGFSSLSFFSREFKKVMGKPPKEYRDGELGKVN